MAVSKAPVGKPVAKPVVQNNTKVVPQKPTGKPVAKPTQVKKK